MRACRKLFTVAFNCSIPEAIDVDWINKVVHCRVGQCAGALQNADTMRSLSAAAERFSHTLISWASS